jgi:hypothetical protein
VPGFPSAPVNAPNAAEVHADAPHPSAPVRLSFAQLLKRVFDIDIAQCPQCGGTLTIIAAIEDPPVIAKILTHLGLSARAPPRAPARAFDPRSHPVQPLSRQSPLALASPRRQNTPKLGAMRGPKSPRSWTEERYSRSPASPTSIRNERCHLSRFSRHLVDLSHVQFFRGNETFGVFFQEHRAIAY